MNDTGYDEIPKKTEDFESKYNNLKKEFRDYIDTSKKNEIFKKKEIQSDFAKKMLIFADSFNRIISADNTYSCEIARNITDNFRENIKVMYQQLLSVSGLIPVDPAPGQLFNDKVHMAIGVEYGSRYPDGSVYSVIRKGYLRDNALIRPAEVIISRYPRGDEKCKKPGIWERISARIFPGKNNLLQFDLQIDQLEHARSETTIRIDEEISQIRSHVDQSLSDLQDSDNILREQIESVGQIKSEISELKGAVIRSLEEKKEIDYRIRIQNENIGLLQMEIEELKKVISTGFNLEYIDKSPDTLETRPEFDSNSNGDETDPEYRYL